MVVQPGGQKEQAITQEQVQLATDLFSDIVKNRELPDTFTPLNIDEIGLPGHKPVVEMVLRQFGRLNNFQSERSAVSLPESERKRIAYRYQRAWNWQGRDDVGAKGLNEHYPLAMKKFNAVPQNYSRRLHCLVLAHTPEWKPQDAAPIWTEDGQAVYFFMSEIIGPKLKLDFGSDLDSRPGDYNLLVSWAFKNVDKIKQLYLDKVNPAHIDTQFARGNGVQLNTIAFENLSNSLLTTNEFNLATETEPIAKRGLSNAELAVAPTTSIVWDFEKFFVIPDQHGGIAGFGDALPTDLKNQLGEEGIKAYCERLNFLSLLNLAVLSDIPGKSEPIKKLDAKLGFGGKLPDILKEFLNIANQAQLQDSLFGVFRERVGEDEQLEAMGENFATREAIIGALTSIRPEWDGESLAYRLKTLLSMMSSSELIGLGSGRALLVQYNERERTKGASEQRLVHYMGMMVKIAKGEGKFGLDGYYDEIRK